MPVGRYEMDLSSPLSIPGSAWVKLGWGRTNVAPTNLLTTHRPHPMEPPAVIFVSVGLLLFVNNSIANKVWREITRSSSVHPSGTSGVISDVRQTRSFQWALSIWKFCVSKKKIISFYFISFFFIYIFKFALNLKTSPGNSCLRSVLICILIDFQMNV